MYPSQLIGHKRGESEFNEVSNHIYGIVTHGLVELRRHGQPPLTLTPGMYFSAPGRAALTGEGHAAIFMRKGFRGLFEIGGPVESAGRLTYIDHCRATVLVSPPRCGDPVLNLLTFPPNLEQTPHIHPTLRMGVVLSGSGACMIDKQKTIDLKPGVAFYLCEGLIHCFHSREALTIIAYHPDSDVGPTDGKHPMLNRTYKI